MLCMYGSPNRSWMERTPYLRYLKECLQHAENCQVFDPEALALRARCLDSQAVPELSQVIFLRLAPHFISIFPLIGVLYCWPILSVC